MTGWPAVEYAMTAWLYSLWTVNGKLSGMNSSADPGWTDGQLLALGPYAVRAGFCVTALGRLPGPVPHMCVLEFTLAIRRDGKCGHAEMTEFIGFKSRQNACAAPRGGRGQPTMTCQQLALR